MPYKTILDSDLQAHCMKAPDGHCHMAKLIVLEEGATTPFHDCELAEASNRINQILCEVRERNEGSGRELMFLGIDDAGFVLAWTTPVFDAESSQQVLRKTFAIGQTEG